MKRRGGSDLQEAFTPSWIRSHIFLLTDGDFVKKIEETPLWRMYFKGKPWEKQSDEIDREKENKVLRERKISFENK